MAKNIETTPAKLNNYIADGGQKFDETLGKYCTVKQNNSLGHVSTEFKTMYRYKVCATLLTCLCTISCKIH